MGINLNKKTKNNKKTNWAYIFIIILVNVSCLFEDLMRVCPAWDL